MSAAVHDPKGKVRLRLKEGVRGTATFSDCGRYRRTLEREWDGAPRPGVVLWIGMNPSTAEGDVDDPTVAKECKFTRAWGFGRYVKANVMDYRATYPDDLLQPGVVARSEANLAAIARLAAEADMVVAAWGALKKPFLRYGDEALAAVIAAGAEPLCLGLTASGAPRHPLYIKGTTKPFRFAGRTARELETA